MNDFLVLAVPGVITQRPRDKGPEKRKNHPTMFSVQQSTGVLKAPNQRMKIPELQKHLKKFWIIELING